jgi:hypothetical protein
VPVQVLRAAEGPPVARVPVRVRPAREPDPELRGRDPELELPGRVQVPAQPVPLPMGGPIRPAPWPR